LFATVNRCSGGSDGFALAHSICFPKSHLLPTRPIENATSALAPGVAKPLTVSTLRACSFTMSGSSRRRVRIRGREPRCSRVCPDRS
jgi:hypothetical protein